MINGINANRVYLALGATDLRKSIDGLSVLVKEAFSLDPFSPSLFVFCNRKKDKVKLLFWDDTGFCLLYKRLERGVFPWPEKSDSDTIQISRRQLSWLLDGLSIEQKKAIPKMAANTVI